MQDSTAWHLAIWVMCTPLAMDFPSCAFIMDRVIGYTVYCEECVL